MRGWVASRPRSALWAGPGLGKTATALAAIDDSLHDALDTSRWLVVGPKLVVADAWPRQFERWDAFAHLTYRNLTAADFGMRAAIDADTGRRTGLEFIDRRAVKRALLAQRQHVHLVSWDWLPWLVKAMGSSWPYDGLVLDEAIFAANSTSERHKACWHVIERLGKARRVVQLTGAPTPNGYEALHGQIRLLDGGERLGRTKTEFQERWLVPDRMNPRAGVVYSWKLGPGAKATIDGLLSDLCVSLKTTDYLDLPECFVNPVHVELPPAARQLYQNLERDLLVQLGDAQVLAPSEAALANKLMQIASGTVYDVGKAAHAVHDAKLDRLEEIVETTDGPVLLAYGFTGDWQRIEDRLGKHAVHVHAPRALDRFRAGKIKLLGMHPASGGHGLDGLQEVSSTAVWYGATYNADHWIQFNARLHRDGQRAGRVVIHQLIAADTIEEYVAGDVLTGKISEQDALLQALAIRKSQHGREGKHGLP